MRKNTKPSSALRAVTLRLTAQDVATLTGWAKSVMLAGDNKPNLSRGARCLLDRARRYGLEAKP